ncbi:flagellar hook-associated protein 1 FlgK [Sulfitobacter marinus]|uniref:Flagellar hook-associated protein 1 n=1 Tax=Sulfitobacter marinus TaxID=394264 RepID=A0A1I6V5K0_9RHOB|nr:flagellar hook-associated protein FlgK [Sulfitobacter marinus]SFT08935.1 flagellar hook-associated protein 1 FlgK [Sulfitobacter marinus]
MSISSAYTIARSGLHSTGGRASLVAGNIANAQTAGYVRREGVQVSGGGVQGSVVELRMVRQIDERLAGMTRGASAELGSAKVTGEILGGYLLTLGQPGDEVSPAARMADFQVGLDLLANNPSDASVQGDVLKRANSLVTSLNSVASALERSRAQASDSFETGVAQVNDALSGIAALNKQLSGASTDISGAGGLMDEMNRRLDALGEHLDFQTRWEADGTLTLHTSGGTELVQGDEASLLTANGQTGALFADGVDITPGQAGGRGFTSGRLAALSDMLSSVIPQMNLQLDELARGLVQSFEAADATVAPGDPGLFTDAGAAFNPANIDGLAGRLTVNASVQPEQGGALWRLRDGVGAVAPGAPGATDQINALIGIFDESQAMDVAAGLGTNLRLGDYAAELVGHHHNTRVTADARAQTANIRLVSYEDGRSNVEGVNVDTELQKLLEIEQAYGANSQVLSSLTDMIDSLLNAV